MQQLSSKSSLASMLATISQSRACVPTKVAVDGCSLGMNAKQVMDELSVCPITDNVEGSMGIYYLSQDFCLLACVQACTDLVEDMLPAVQQSGVAGALIVQPSEAHHFDHSYVTSVIKRRPGTFVGCLLADPRPGQNGLAKLERLIIEDGYRAVRFHPYRWPEGENMANEVHPACPASHFLLYRMATNCFPKHPK